MRYNPFQPNKIVNPSMFIGRLEELKAIEQCLFQTKHDNPEHFLILGERGIGKSSLLVYVDAIARGRLEAANSRHFSFVTVPVDLGSCTTQADIVRTVARGIKLAITDFQVAQEAAKKLLDWLSKWEVLGVRFHRDNPDVDPDDIADELIARIATFIRESAGHIYGLVILIDEADGPPVEAGLGKFCKFFSERLTKRECDRVLIALAGLPIVLKKMKDSHESSPRLFSTVSLKPLETSEREEVIRRGLADANLRNGETVTITNDALEFLVELSEGYPHFVQQFSYSAFDENEDQVIDSEDVVNGAFRENGAIDQLGRKYFDELYYRKIGSDDYRKVLNAMAEHGDAWVARKDLIAESGIKATTMNNALAALKGRNIILLDEGRPGYYRLPTRSFAAWINAINAVEDRKEEAEESLL